MGEIRWLSRFLRQIWWPQREHQVGDSAANRVARYAEMMYWSKIFIPTLREDPAQAEGDPHRLLIRAGYIRQHARGSYNYLFAAQRSLLDRGDDAAGDGRHGRAGDVFRRSPSRRPRGPGIARELRSHREFPQIWHQFAQHQFAQHQFAQMVQQSFSLDLSADGLDQACEKHSRAYRRVLQRCGLEFIAAGNDFMALSEAGGDFIVRGNDYAANLETATGIAASARDSRPRR